MLRRKDALLIALVLLLAAGAYGVSVLSRQGQTLSGLVNIYANGALYASVPLGEARQVRVEQADGHVNVVQIDEKGAVMVYSSCKNQLCIQQGEVTVDNWTRRSMGRSIICLPNRVQVELALSLSQEEWVDLDAPDV